MLHEEDKHTSKCCPFLACCVLQFFLLTIYKPLLSTLDELQKWWSCSLISVICTRAVYLFMRYRVISVKCINICAGQINLWHPISLYTGIPVLLSCADSVIKKLSSVVHFEYRILLMASTPPFNSPQKGKFGKGLLSPPRHETNTKKYHGVPLKKTGCFLLVLVYANPKMRRVFTRLRKLNMESVSLALLSICPWKIIRALEFYQWLRDLGFCEFKKK